MNINEHDGLEQRCRMLGHPVPFRYCREVTSGLPCRLVLDCWQGRFDAEAFLRKHYTAEQIKNVLAPPKPKLATIVELIEQAKKNAEQVDN